MRKMTKAQCKNNDRIMAWLNNKPFRENSRAKAEVPVLDILDVLEQYTPPDVTGAGQFFTPLEMGEALIGYMDIPWYNGEGARILDPCAGIGHLLYPIARHLPDAQIVAVEIEEVCVKIGQRLFPNIEWHWEIPFEMVEAMENSYDIVVLNPPFNTRRGMYPGEEMCNGLCTKSEHIFLAFAAHVLKPGGQVGIIAPYNYIDRFPKAFSRWIDSQLLLEHTWGPLPGEFACSSIQVHGYIFSKRETS